MSAGLGVPLLRVEGLSCALAGRYVLDEVGFVIAASERVGLFGPSGAGKSLLLRALVGLAPPTAELSGTLTWRDQAPRRLDEPAALAGLRGRAIAYVPQDARASLDPIRSVVAQLGELVARHRSSRSVSALLELVELAPEVASARPTELSGGMAQRVAIAAALACGPGLLLADEPTASLDNLSQGRVLDALDHMCEAGEAACILVSHDLAVLADRCTRIIGLVDGEIALDSSVEEALATAQPVLSDLVAAATSGGEVDA